MAFMTALSISSTNDVNTANLAYEASTVSPNVNTTNPQVSTANFSDNAMYAFMVENPNGSNLLQQDLEQIHKDDLEAMDLRWQLSLLGMRAKRYFQRTRNKIFINANDTAGYDKLKVECFNSHKMGHFAREYRAQRNQDGQFRNQDNTRKQRNNKDTSLKAMMYIDDKFVCDPNKTPHSSQRPPHNCPKCGNSSDGQNCRQCALLRKKVKEVWFIICDENKIFEDFLNNSESSNDDTNVVNAPQEPFVFNQDPSENSSQSPPHIDHHCCYGCGDSLDDIFCHQCTCESCGNGAHYSYNCPLKVLIISNLEPCHNQKVEEFPQTLQSSNPTCYFGDENSFAYDSTPNFVNDSPNVFSPPSQPLTDSYKFCENAAHFSHDCPPQRIPIYYDDNDDEKSSTPLRDIIISKLPSCIAITPVLSTEEPNVSFIMGDEHLDTILEKESDEFIKSSVENLVPNPSESEDLSNIGRECDVLICDDFTTFSNLLFDADDNFSSSDDESFYDEEISKENYSNPLFDEEIISIKIDPHHFNAKSDLIESLLNQDSLIISSSKIDSLLDEFAEFNSKNSDVVNESFSASFILVEDSDSLMEKIDLSLTLDDSMPPGIENDDYESEGDILFLEELLSSYSFSLPENESFHFDIPSSPRPPTKPPDDDEINNMRKASKGYNGVEIPLFPTMLIQGQIDQDKTDVWCCLHYARVRKLEHKVKTSQHRRKVRVVLSDDEEDLEDPSKQGRKITEIDENPSISLVQDEGTSWIQKDYEIQWRTSADTEILLDQEEPTELMKDLGSSEKNQVGYKQSHFKGMSYKDIRLIFERVWDQIHAFVPMDFEIENSKPVGGSRKKTVAKKRIGVELDKESAKRQKLKDVTEEEVTAEYENEKEELKFKDNS
nr:hypothetical protein [Tanacetum cinerariifolium]